MTGRFKFMTPKRYGETHNGKTPQQDNVKCGFQKVKGVKVWGCFVRSNPDGEWEYSDEELNSAQKKQSSKTKKTCYEKAKWRHTWLTW